MDDIRTYLKIMLETRKLPGRLVFDGLGKSECQEKIQKALKNPKVKFLIEQLEKSGCPINPEKFIRGVRCSTRALAIYHSGAGAVVCCNFVRFQDEVTTGLIHELIHAYDDCRAKNLDWNNCYHRACAEIRAAHLSGDCHYMREYLRGVSNLRGHEPECVRRRAAISVGTHPKCTKYLTKLAMDSVWDICYNDTKPFDKAP